MAPFFMSSSLFSIAHRRSKAKNKTSPDLSQPPSPPALYSRSLPNIQDLHDIPSRFIKEFHPILQRKAVIDSISASSMLGEQSTLEPVTSSVPTFFPEALLAAENNSPKLGYQPTELSDDPVFLSGQVLTSEINSPPKMEESAPQVEHSDDSVSPFGLDEQSTPRAEFSDDLVSSSELDEQSTPRVRSYNGSVPSELDEQATPRALSSGDLTSCPESTLSSENETFKLSVTGDNAPEVAVNDRSIAVDMSTCVTPLATKRRALIPEGLSRTSVAETTWSNSENAKLLEELSDLALIFGAPEETYIPTKAISIPSGVSLCDHEHIITSLEKSLAETKDLKERFMVELEELWGDYNELNNVYHDLKSEYQIERMKNVKLTQSSVSMKHDAFRLLNKQEWEISQMKRFIAAMVDIKLHTPVFYDASEAIQNGSSADAALIDAIKNAAEKPDSPWSAIMPAIIGERPQELYLNAVKRSARLCGELRESNKKYKWWKMKAQIDPRHTNCITPSSSSVSLVLNEIMPQSKQETETGCIDNLLDRLKAGTPITIVTPVIEGSSGFGDAVPPPPTPIAKTSVSDTSRAPVRTPFSSPRSSADITTQLPEPSEYSVSIADESRSTIRPYVPGRALFGKDGFGRTPAGLFDRDGPGDLPDYPVLSNGSSRESGIAYAPSQPAIQAAVTHDSDNFSDSQESLGLEYIDENHDSGFVDAVSPCAVENAIIDTTTQPSESPKSLNLDEIPHDGRCNPVLRDSDSDDSSVTVKRGEEVPESLQRTVMISEGLINEVPGSVLQTESISEESRGPTHESVLPINEAPRERKDKVRETMSQASEIAEQSRDAVERSSLTSIVQSASKRSITNLKRLTTSSSKLRQSISSGLKHIRRISFGSNNGERTVPEISHPITLHSHRRISSASGKENRSPHTKGLSADSNNTPISARPVTSIPRKGLRRPTISSALKTVQVTLPTNRSSIPQPGAQKKRDRVSFESPVAANIPIRKRKPLSNIAVSTTNAQRPGTHRGVLDQGRKAVRTLTKLIS
ncbi:hypothetical protein AX15_005157 [Amanita polypyramis BW_CC]|nr:hypothetical protein AX15_005157 [Amanita polypyramis BW_CC]